MRAIIIALICAVLVALFAPSALRGERGRLVAPPLALAACHQARVGLRVAASGLRQCLAARGQMLFAAARGSGRSPWQNLLRGRTDSPALMGLSATAPVPLGPAGRRWLHGGLRALVGIVGALSAIWVFGPTTYSWGMARVRVAVAPARHGETAIVLTPVGDITARTHRTPLRLTVQLDRLHLPVLRRMAREMPDPQKVVGDLERRARHSAERFALRLLLLAFVGASLASILLLRGALRWHLVAGVVGTAVVAGLLAGTVGTFKRDAFRNLRYTGPLSEAPEVVRFAREGLASLHRLRGRMDAISAGLAQFHASLADADPKAPRANDIRVLHVSDIHNNPVAFDFIEQFTRRFRVDLIVNTGDITDYGTEVEEMVRTRMRQVALPQLFITGNHDSLTTVASLQQSDNRVRVLDGAVATEEGIRFMGWPDPLSRRVGYGEVNASPEDLDALERRIRADVAAQETPPDVLLVHNHRVAERLKGLAPVVLYGHSHRASVRREGETVFVNAGTTGAAGARYFQAPEGVPFSAVVLHFSREHPGHLVAADLLRMRGPEGEFALERYSLNGQLKEKEGDGEP